jgi:hypothetical protein
VVVAVWLRVWRVEATSEVVEVPMIFTFQADTLLLQRNFEAAVHSLAFKKRCRTNGADSGQFGRIARS